MAERLNAADSKSAEGANPPWVRIPPFPPENITAGNHGGFFVRVVSITIKKSSRYIIKAR